VSQASPVLAAPRRPADLASIAFCSLTWGTTWFVITLQLGTVPPVVSVVYRFALAAMLLFGWLILRGEPIRLNRAQHVAAAGQGLFTFALDYSLVYLAEERVASAVVAVMFAGLAFANLVLFRAILGQKAGRGAWIGAALGVAGVAVMSAAELARRRWTRGRSSAWCWRWWAWGRRRSATCSPGAASRSARRWARPWPGAWPTACWRWWRTCW
jgi:drug/metabolite transporter (DMT)-like permease